MAASYPTSVKSFTTKNSGDTIQHTHINDLQDEVAALEGGLLNGVAPLNSSRSTLAALSVTGGSTVAALNAGNTTLANLSVTGGATFAGGFAFGNSTFGNITVSSGSTLGSLTVTGGSTLASLHVTGVTQLASLYAGPSTLTQLSVTGNCTLAHLNVPGNSTLTQLSVTGGSTLANVQMSSNCTIAGGLTVTGGVTLGAVTAGSLSISGGSTLGTLESSNSTLANAQITGNCTIAGTLTCTSFMPVVKSFVQAYAESAYSIASTSAVTVHLDGELSDNLAEYDTATYTFTPQSSGIYLITGRVKTAGGSANGPNLSILVNVSVVAQLDDLRTGTAPNLPLCLTTVQNLSSGASGAVTMRLQYTASSGVAVSTGWAYTALEIVRLF